MTEENSPAHANVVYFYFSQGHYLHFREATDDQVHAWQHELASGSVFTIVSGQYKYTVNSKKVEYMEAARYPK